MIVVDNDGNVVSGVVYGGVVDVGYLLIAKLSFLVW